VYTPNATAAKSSETTAEPSATSSATAAASSATAAASIATAATIVANVIHELVDLVPGSTGVQAVTAPLEGLNLPGSSGAQQLSVPKSISDEILLFMTSGISTDSSKAISKEFYKYK
jgi:hypothetical protein